MLDVSMLLGCLSLGMEPALMLAIVEQESSGNPIAINVNEWEGEPVVPVSADDVVEAAGLFVDAGYTVDVGLAGINSANLERFGVAYAEAIDPCTSLALGETIFMENLETARAKGHQGDKALRAALSLYNTGSMTRGLDNGYVDSVWQRYVNGDAYLARTGSSQVAWSPVNAGKPSIDPSADASSGTELTEESSLVPWHSRADHTPMNAVDERRGQRD